MCAAAVCSHGPQRRRRGALFVQQTHQCPLEWGVLLQGVSGSPPMLRSPITEQNLALRTSSKHTAKGTFIYLPSRPLPQQPSFTRICSAISSRPMATACQKGNKFLMMSLCHGDWRSIARRWSWDVRMPMGPIFFLQTRQNAKLRFWHEAWPLTVIAKSCFCLEGSVFVYNNITILFLSSLISRFSHHHHYHRKKTIPKITITKACPVTITLLT